MHSRIFQLETGDVNFEELDEIILSEYEVFPMMEDKVDYVSEDTDYLEDIAWLSQVYDLDVYDITGQKVIGRGKILKDVSNDDHFLYIRKDQFIWNMKKNIISQYNKLYQTLKNDFINVKDPDINNLINIDSEIQDASFKYGFYFIIEEILYSPNPWFLRHIEDIKTDKFFIINSLDYHY